MADLDDLIAFLSASPSPYHAVAEAARRLEAAGFARRDLAAAWDGGEGDWYVARGGALIAWSVSAATGNRPFDPFRIVGAHTDSPNLRLKPRPDIGSHGWKQLGVEVYGGALWNSWLDRDLGLSGRIATDGFDEPTLVRIDRPLARVPQLAIHLDRGVNENGLTLNPQQDLTPVWGVGPVREGELLELVAEAAGISRPDEVLGWDLMFHDLTPPTRLGKDGELLAASRLDDQLSCWAAVEALIDQRNTFGDVDPAKVTNPDVVAVACLYDHEEVGSASATGAAGGLLEQVLERIVASRSGDRTDLLRALAASICVSADGAHATHPNHPERHEPGHSIAVNGGPVIKVNANQRYATTAPTAAVMAEACIRAEVPHQHFVSRNDQPCGSTIGPLAAARLGMATVDVGVAQLSMHSARELCGADDPERLHLALCSFFRMGGDDGNGLAPDGGWRAIET